MSSTAPAASPRPARELFRRSALDARDGKATSLDELATPTAGAWAVLLVLASFVGLLFAGAALLSIEVTVKAPGALRAPNGLRSVESVLSGSVTEVLARSGDRVELGQIVVRLDDAQLQATLTLRDKELQVLREDTREAARADESLLENVTVALRRQQAALEKRMAIQSQQLRQRSSRLRNVRQLVREGAASATDELAVRESMQLASEALSILESQVAQLQLDMADRTRAFKLRENERRAALSRAQASVDEAQSLLKLVEIRAPASGRLESLLAAPGAVIGPGEIIAQIVPEDAPREIVAFLPASETAFVRPGSLASVEMESLPVNEFGMARARVTRISADIANARESAAVFGERLPGAFVRVELSLLEEQTAATMLPHLRSGERVTVRLHRRERRILGLLFDFARRWLGQ